MWHTGESRGRRRQGGSCSLRQYLWMIACACANGFAVSTWTANLFARLQWMLHCLPLHCLPLCRSSTAPNATWNCCIARIYLEILPRPASAVKVCPICKCNVACALLRHRLWLRLCRASSDVPHKSQLHKPISHLLAQNAAQCRRGTWPGGRLGRGGGVRVGIMQTFGALSTQLAGNRNRNRRWAAVSREG